MKALFALLVRSQRICHLQQNASSDLCGDIGRDHRQQELLLLLALEFQTDSVVYELLSARECGLALLLENASLIETVESEERDDNRRRQSGRQVREEEHFQEKRAEDGCRLEEESGANAQTQHCGAQEEREEHRQQRVVLVCGAQGGQCCAEEEGQNGKSAVEARGEQSLRKKSRKQMNEKQKNDSDDQRHRDDTLDDREDDAIDDRDDDQSVKKRTTRVELILALQSFQVLVVVSWLWRGNGESVGEGGERERTTVRVILR